MYQTDDPSRSGQGQLDGWMNMQNHSAVMTKISCLRIPSGVKHRSCSSIRAVSVGKKPETCSAAHKQNIFFFSSAAVWNPCSLVSCYC